MYTPSAVPADVKDLVAFLRNELSTIAAQMSNVDSIVLPTLYAAPKRIVEGMVVKADGTTWNPGSGGGIYARISGAWVKL